MKLDHNLLVVFDRVYRLANLSRAGVSLGISQPAVSNALNRLRAIYDDPLFIKTSQGMLPTPFAREIAPTIQSALALIEETLEANRTFDPRTSDRRFVIALTDYGSAVLLPTLMAALCREAPHVALKVVRLDQQDVLKRLERNEVNLAFSSQVDAGADFYEKRLFNDAFVCVISARHPAVGLSITLEQFLAHGHVLYTPQEGSSGVVDQALARRGLACRTRLYAPHAMVIPAIIQESDLIVTLPERMARTFRPENDFRLLEPPLAVPGFEMKMLWHRVDADDDASIWLRELCSRLFRTSPHAIRAKAG